MPTYHFRGVLSRPATISVEAHDLPAAKAEMKTDWGWILVDEGALDSAVFEWHESTPIIEVGDDGVETVHAGDDAGVPQ